MPYNRLSTNHNTRPRAHRCPRRGCETQVPDELFACLPCWRALSSEAQAEIRRTSKLYVLHPIRRAAFRLADASWAHAWPTLYSADITRP